MNDLSICQMICDAECANCLASDTCPTDECKDCLWHKRFEHNDCEWKDKEGQ